MNLNDFDFELPEGLIAQEPCPERDQSRLMVLNRKSKGIEHRLFFEIADYLEPGDLLVINDTMVIPARLAGRKETGGKAEVFLLERVSGKEEIWECMVGAKRVRKGLVIEFNEALRGEVLEEVGDGRFRLLFHGKRPFEDVLEEIGQVPLPPYIKRSQKSGVRSQESKPGDSPGFTDAAERSRRIGTVPGFRDRERYQTIFAEKKGAVAAPTAGLHFTEGLLKKIKDKGIEVVPITLHVGPGTFLPVKVQNIEEHRMLPERYEISPDAAIKINNAKMEGRRVVAAGSTATRALEAAAAPFLSSEFGARSSELKDKNWGIKPGIDRTAIFIYPGYTFKIVDALITNFHLPKSTLLMLVSAFANRDLIFKAYREAIDKEYRFYSYGDAMMIL